MPRASTHVCEVPLRAGLHEVAVLGSRFEAARQLFNAVLGEALRRLARMRRDPAFDQAKALPRGSSSKDATPLQKVQAQARREAFAALRRKHGFREYDLHQHPSLGKGCWLREHLDINTAQKVATRAFRAVERYSFGQAGKPRFKRYGEVESVEGKSNAAGIRFRDDEVLWDGSHGKLRMEVLWDPADPVHAHTRRAIEASGVKYVRLLLRAVRGRRLPYAQLVLLGEALRKPKHAIGTGTVGLDLGPSQVAVVTEGHVERIPFCPGLDRKEAARRRYLRKLDRQQRANNPENYNPDGTLKPRRLRKPWKASRSQVRTREALAEVLRALAAQRRALQGEVVHQVLALGNQVVTEKVNKRSWAKLWGRSVGHKAPGAFEARVKLLAEASSGSFEAVETRTTCLSSRCLCGKRVKKALSKRTHTCGCAFIPEGMHADRDEFSAFLALHCQGGLLDEQAARASWSAWGVDILLRASSSLKQAANGEAWPPLRGRGPRRSGSQRSDSSAREAQGLPSGERGAEVALFHGAKAPPGTPGL